MAKDFFLTDAITFSSLQTEETTNVIYFIP